MLHLTNILLDLYVAPGGPGSVAPTDELFDVLLDALSSLYEVCMGIKNIFMSIGNTIIGWFN